MRLVIIESPYAGDITGNVAYARQCVRDCLSRGDAPIASHLLYTQDSILNDAKPEDRKLGMEAGWAWLPVCQAVVVYLDRGISMGMRQGVERARLKGKKVEFRLLEQKEEVDAPVL